MFRVCIHFYLHHADTLGARASACTAASTAASAAAAETAGGGTVKVAFIPAAGTARLT